MVQVFPSGSVVLWIPAGGPLIIIQPSLFGSVNTDSSVSVTLWLKCVLIANGHLVAAPKSAPIVF